MNTASSTVWLSGPLPWCAACLESRVRLHDHYFCPCCSDDKPATVPPPRMALDRPTPIATSSGEA